MLREAAGAEVGAEAGAAVEEGVAGVVADDVCTAASAMDAALRAWGLCRCALLTADAAEPLSWTLERLKVAIVA